MAAVLHSCLLSPHGAHAHKMHLLLGGSGKGARNACAPACAQTRTTAQYKRQQTHTNAPNICAHRQMHAPATYVDATNKHGVCYSTDSKRIKALLNILNSRSNFESGCRCAAHLCHPPMPPPTTTYHEEEDACRQMRQQRDGSHEYGHLRHACRWKQTWVHQTCRSLPG